MGQPEQIEQHVFEIGGRERDRRHAARRQSAVRRSWRGHRGAAAHDRPGAGGPSALSRGHQRRARHGRVAGSRPDPDLGARRRADRGVGHRGVRGGGRRHPFRRRGARRAGRVSGRHAARRVGRGRVVPDRLGGDRRRVPVAEGRDAQPARGRRGRRDLLTGRRAVQSPAPQRRADRRPAGARSCCSRRRSRSRCRLTGWRRSC